MTAVTNFTIGQIKAAHAKVKSGLDFPRYIQEIRQIGVTSYETHVVDGHTNYYGSDNHQASATAKYAPLAIAVEANAGAFETALKTHQQGKTDYLTFCSDCAKYGIEKWVVRLDKMTCIYYDKVGNDILIEKIPE
jgi:uncharacterized protein YbcV (DUF1398 family)